MAKKRRPPKKPANSENLVFGSALNGNSGPASQNSPPRTPLDGTLTFQAAEATFSTSMDQNTVRTPLLYIDPLFDQILILFPQDNMREQNRRFRHFYRYDPHIRSIIDFHTETALSDFALRMPDSSEGEDYYNDFKNRKNLLDMLINLNRDYWLLGEGFAFGNWDTTSQEFMDFVQFPPEEVMVAGSYISSERIFSLRPDQNLQKMMRSNDPSEAALTNYIDKMMPEHAQSVRRGQPHPLPSERLVVLQRKMAPYIMRGVSPVAAAVKDLLYQDNLILFRNAFIQRHSYPLKIFKLGDANKGYIPSAKHFNQFRQQLVSAINDPDFSIITHPFVHVEYFTGHDKIVNLIPLFEMVQKRIFMALFVNEALISGEKTPYASSVAFMRALLYRYLTIRNSMEVEIKRKVFAPLSRARGFYRPTQAEVAHRVQTGRDDSRLLIPDFIWNKANLLSNQALMQMAMRLREQHEIPMRYICEMFGWEWDDMLRELKKEEGTRTDRSWRDAKKKKLEDNEIIAKHTLMGENFDNAMKLALREQLEAVEKPKEPEEPAKKKLEIPKKPGDKTKPPEVPTVKPVVPPDTSVKNEEVPGEKGEAPQTPPTGEGARRPRPTEEPGSEPSNV